MTFPFWVFLQLLRVKVSFKSLVFCRLTCENIIRMEKLKLLFGLVFFHSDRICYWLGNTLSKLVSYYLQEISGQEIHFPIKNSCVFLIFFYMKYNSIYPNIEVIIFH